MTQECSKSVAELTLWMVSDWERVGFLMALMAFQSQWRRCWMVARSWLISVKTSSFVFLVKIGQAMRTDENWSQNDRLLVTERPLIGDYNRTRVSGSPMLEWVFCDVKLRPAIGDIGHSKCKEWQHFKTFFWSPKTLCIVITMLNLQLECKKARWKSFAGHEVRCPGKVLLVTKLR